MKKRNSGNRNKKPKHEPAKIEVGGENSEGTSSGLSYSWGKPFKIFCWKIGGDWKVGKKIAQFKNKTLVEVDCNVNK